MAHADLLAQTVRSRLLAHRDRSIQGLQEVLTALVLSPDLKITDSTLQALWDTVAAWESLAKSLHTGTAGYWDRDLGEEPGRLYRQAKHSMRVLQTMYGPNAADS